MYRVIALALLVCCSSISAHAQTIPKSLQQDPNGEAALRDRKNAWTVGIGGGLLEGTRLRQVDELARVVADGDNMRVMPFISQGSASNLEDLLYLRGVDVVVTQSDVFEFFRKERNTPISTKEFITSSASRPRRLTLLPGRKFAGWRTCAARKSTSDRMGPPEP
jgi:hypothetical protein